MSARTDHYRPLHRPRPFFQPSPTVRLHFFASPSLVAGCANVRGRPHRCRDSANPSRFFLLLPPSALEAHWNADIQTYHFFPLRRAGRGAMAIRRRHRVPTQRCARPAPSNAPHRGRSGPHSACSALTRACGVCACSLAAFPCVCLPSLRFLCAVWPFHFFASPCAQVLTTAPCTSTWLDFGAAGLHFGCSTARLIGAGDMTA